MSPRTIVIDFETYYAKDYHLNTGRKGGLSYPLYIADPRFKVHGMWVDDGQRQYRVPPEKVVEVLTREYSNDILVGHNLFFDLAILAWHFKYRPKYVIDTLLLANHVLGSAKESLGGSNSLESLAVLLRLPIQKGMEIKQFEGVRDLDDLQLDVLDAYARNDVRLTRMVLDRLMPSVTNPDFELWLLDHTLRIYTEKLLGIDKAKLEATEKKVKDRLEQLVAGAGVPLEVLSSNKQFAQELAERCKAGKVKFPRKQRPTTATEKKKLVEAGVKLRDLPKMQTVPALSKQDAAFTNLVECGVKPVEALVQARLAARSADTVMARLNTMRAYAERFGGIPVHLVYYGAHTGRFSGGGGFNFQNLTSPGRAATPFDREVATMVRECIVPLRPGDVFVAVDAAQIEARVVAWLAGEVELLAAFESGADVYSVFIADVLQVEVRKPTKDDPPEKAANLKLLRQIGKEAVLGLGFGMGVDKFESRLRQNKEVRGMIERGDLTRETIESIVAGYREKYQNIVHFWRDLNAAFLDAIRGATRRVGVLLVKKHADKVVKIVLPSGRALYYRDLRMVKGEDWRGRPKTEWKHGAGQKIYGGLLAENVTQAIARDVLAEQGIAASEEAGFSVALHIHDEVVAQVPAGEGQAVHDFLVKSLSTAPAWGAGMVLGAEGGVAKNLSK